MVSLRDVEKIALTMPGATKELRDDDRPAFLVDHKLFCFHRTRRRDALDPKTGEPLDDVLIFRVADEEMNSMWLAQRPSVYFTTEHFKGYPYILLRIPALVEIDHDELYELVTDAWLTQAPKRVAKSWLAEQGLAGESE